MGCAQKSQRIIRIDDRNAFAVDHDVFIGGHIDIIGDLVPKILEQLRHFGHIDDGFTPFMLAGVNDDIRIGRVLDEFLHILAVVTNVFNIG
ncbi:hypothetical protein D3C77_452050 [compost metagenome]